MYHSDHYTVYQLFFLIHYFQNSIHQTEHSLDSYIFPTQLKTSMHFNYSKATTLTDEFFSCGVDVERTLDIFRANKIIFL